MKNLLKITAASSAMLLVSCGDASGELVNLPPTPVPTAVTKFLKKVTATPTGSAGSNVVYNYTSGKLTTVVDSNLNSTDQLEYVATQISKITETVASSQTSVYNLSYNGTQLSAVSGNLYPNLTFQSTLTYTAGKLTFIQSNYSVAPGAALDRTKKITLEYAGENISKAVIVEETFQPAATITTTLLFSDFDTNPNPFRTLPAAYTIAKAINSNDMKMISGLSVNNYKTVTVQSTGASTTETRTITYDAQAYPTKTVSSAEVKDFEYIQ